MPIIEFNDVSKAFIIQTEQPRSFQELLVNRWRRTKSRSEQYWALKNVSFQLEAGESLGLVGANGSGKSTALKLISKIIEPTSGNITVRGRVAALLELGAGFHPDLSGRENVYLNGSILGLRWTDIRHRFDDIVSFAELERFIDTPIRNYSSGMLMRLGFAVATAFQPDILLIDEVLAVGDQAFQSRCLRRIYEIQEQGATIVLVSHDLTSVQKLCQNALWLSEGCACAIGPTESVISRYLEHLWTNEHEKQAEDVSTSPEPPPPSPEPEHRPMEGRWGSGEVRIEKAEMLNGAGAPVNVFHTGDPFIVRMWYNAATPVSLPAFGVSIYDQSGNRLNGPNTVWGGEPIRSVQGRGYVDYIVDSLPLLSGQYDLTVAVYDRHITHPYDHWHRGFSFTVIPGDVERQDGSLYIPCRWLHKPGVTSTAIDAVGPLVSVAAAGDT